jgi:glutaconate CoA-transferase, subunit B
MADYTASEMMVVAAARHLQDGQAVFVGVGLPLLAAILAKRTHAPGVVLLCESGIVDGNPVRLPLSVADPSLVDGAAGIFSMLDYFNLYLLGGRIDVGFIGGAQVDRWGNVNSTVIGPYGKPKVRLPGSGGACEIAAHARQVWVIMPQSPRRFVAQVDFITSPGWCGGPEGRQALGYRGGGPALVVSDKGLLRFDASGEMILTALHPNVSVEETRQATGWPLKEAERLDRIEPPMAEELAALRSLDPARMFLDRGA